MDDAKYLKNLKLMLGITDDLENDRLNLIIANSKTQLQNRIEDAQIPVNLEYIVLEIAIRRFNRISSEGLKQDSVEGHSITFYDPEDDFKPFLSEIAKYNLTITPTPAGPARKGRVVVY